MLLFSQLRLKNCASDLRIPLNLLELIFIIIEANYPKNVALLIGVLLRCELGFLLGLLAYKVLLGLGFEGVVLVETILIDFLVPDFLYQKFLKVHFSANEFLLNISKNAWVDDSFRSKQAYFMCFIAYNWVCFVSLTVYLFQFILKLFYLSFKALDGLEIGFCYRAGLNFALIIHSDLDSFDDSLQFELNNDEYVRFCIFSFRIFWLGQEPLAWGRRFCRW